MCTVSFVNSLDTVTITSNRDENVSRPSATDPKVYHHNHRKIIFPKDPVGGGTWFAINDLGTAVVLLNGAEVKHIRRSTYRASRGLIALQIIGARDSLKKWEAEDLTDIEPFTLIIYQLRKLYRLRWNAKTKEIKVLDSTQNYIWSSATLYAAQVQKQRQQWFEDFVALKPGIQPEDILHFHRHTRSEDKENGLVIDRMGQVRTQHITQVRFISNKVELTHLNLLADTSTSVSFLTL